MGRTRRGRWKLAGRITLACVLLILGWMIVRQVFGHAHGPNHRHHVARSQLGGLAAKLHQYRLDTGRFPERLEDLTSDDGLGPYAKPREFSDPWGAPFYYRVDVARGSFALFTLGSDGRIGGGGNARDIDAADVDR